LTLACIQKIPVFAGVTYTFNLTRDAIGVRAIIAVAKVVLNKYIHANTCITAWTTCGCVLNQKEPCYALSAVNLIQAASTWSDTFDADISTWERLKLTLVFTAVCAD
jgi:hypothetical protein